MGFDVNDCGLDAPRLDNAFHLVQTDVGQSDGLAPTLVHQALQRPPRLQQRQIRSGGTHRGPSLKIGGGFSPLPSTTPRCTEFPTYFRDAYPFVGKVIESPHRPRLVRLEGSGEVAPLRRCAHSVAPPGRSLPSDEAYRGHGLEGRHHHGRVPRHRRRAGARVPARGYRVVANSRSISPDAYEGDVLAVAGDIADPAVAERVVGGAVAAFGRVDTLVNNAGVFVPGPFSEYTDDDYARVVWLNLGGFFRGHPEGFRDLQRELRRPVRTTCWVNRFHLPMEQLGIKPDGASDNLDGLLRLVLGEPWVGRERGTGRVSRERRRPPVVSFNRCDRGEDRSGGGTSLPGGRSGRGPRVAGRSWRAPARLEGASGTAYASLLRLEQSRESIVSPCCEAP